MPNPNSGTFDRASPLAPARFVYPIGAARPASWIGNTVCTLFARYMAWRAQRVTQRLLSSLDAATLRDLGLTDIESEVYGDPRDRMRGYDPEWQRRDR